MACILCRWLCERFNSPERGTEAFWAYEREWEFAYSSGWEPYEGGDQLQDRREYAWELTKNDPDNALRQFEALAADGDAWAMGFLGTWYENGTHVEQDLQRAEQYCHDAIRAGSWHATQQLARLLFVHSKEDRWDAILADGDAKGFVLSSVQLARYRYERSPTRATAREVRPLLERAAAAGHPGARLRLARWKIFRYFGLGEIRQGIREIRAVHDQLEKGDLPEIEENWLPAKEVA